MPPRARVCTACKAAKTKCCLDGLPWDPQSGRKCDRCARLGVRCTAAPQAVDKRKAFSSSSAVVPCRAVAPGGGMLLHIAPSSMLTQALAQVPGTTSSSFADTLSYVLAPGASPVAARYVLRAIASTARRRGTYELIEFVTRLCNHYDIALDHVMAEVHEHRRV